MTKINSNASEMGSLFHKIKEMYYTANPDHPAVNETAEEKMKSMHPMKSLEMMAKHPDFDSLILSLTMDDGFSVNYRHRQ